MGEMPPSTWGMSGLTSRTARDASLTILANLNHSGSTSKSQCDLLLGSFQKVTASIIVKKLLFAGPAEKNLRLGVRHQLIAGAAQHGFETGPVWNPPISPVASVGMLDEV